MLAAKAQLWNKRFISFFPDFMSISLKTTLIRRLKTLIPTFFRCRTLFYLIVLNETVM